MMVKNDRPVQILVSLLKEFGISHIVASPGTGNLPLVRTLQNDNFFKLYSVVDERSAAYIACGIAAELDAPVVLTCTGATASRNYLPGLTEAYYRKLPILAVTASRHPSEIGQYVPQALDRSSMQNDVCNLSVDVTIPRCREDDLYCNRLLNQAILELTRFGGGPVHVNLESQVSAGYESAELMRERCIKRYTHLDILPEVPKGKIGVFVGSHRKFSNSDEKMIEEFCRKYDAVVLCDQTSNYRGDHRVLANLVVNQDNSLTQLADFDLIVHIGTVSGAYMRLRPRETWRIASDGEIRDTFGCLSAVFQMTETEFFKFYSKKTIQNENNGQLEKWRVARKDILSKITDLPFSNLWIAKELSQNIPCGSIVHLGILNSLRSWNMFETPKDVEIYSNTGGFGIDGVLSTAIGAALVSPEKIVFVIIGDLAFFYDINVLGNRHLPSNLRVVLINNAEGVEFKNYSHFASSFGKQTDPYTAAAGHNGNKSRELVKQFTEALGIEYLHAENKSEFSKCKEIILSDTRRDKALLCEVFTNEVDESAALQIVCSISVDTKGAMKNAAKKILGDKGIEVIKKVAGKR